MKKSVVTVLLFTMLMALFLPAHADNLVSTQLITLKDAGFTKSDGWNEETWANSQGSAEMGSNLITYDIGNFGQYQPSNLEPGWYDVSFWNLKYTGQSNPLYLEASVYSNQKSIDNIKLTPPDDNLEDRTGEWTKIGTYYFSGSNDEYVRLISTGMCRISDVKFEKNDEFQFTYRVGYKSEECIKEGTWYTLSWPDSTGDTEKASAYGITKNNYVQYQPAAGALEEGYYDIYFWNLKFADTNPVKMTASVSSGGEIREKISLPVTTATEDRTGAWSKIGTYWFKGDGDEFVRLVTTGEEYARVADVKFVKNDDYVPPALTYRIGYRSPQCTKTGTWYPVKWPDSTGDTENASGYTSQKGDSVRYTPESMEPGWYDVSFWNLRYDAQTNPIKMTATVRFNGKTKTDIALPTNTTTEEKNGRWDKIGTYYFTGTGDEYVELVATGGLSTRVADVQFVKNDSYTPPPSLGDQEVIVESDIGEWTLDSAPGIYSLYYKKSDAAGAGSLEVSVDGEKIDSGQIVIDPEGEEWVWFGAYSFEDLQTIKVKFYLSMETGSAIHEIKFVPASQTDLVVAGIEIRDRVSGGSTVDSLKPGILSAEIKVDNRGEEKQVAAVIELYQDGQQIERKVGETVSIPSGGQAVLKSEELAVLGLDDSMVVKAFLSQDGVTTACSAVRLLYPAYQYYQSQDNLLILPSSFSNLGTWSEVKFEGTITGTALQGFLAQPAATTMPANAQIKLDEAGTYRVWVHSRNFSTDPNARYFSVSVNDQKLDTTFGQAGQDSFCWEDGGTVELQAGINKISAFDDSKYYARFDAIYLTKDTAAAAPPEEYALLEKQSKIVIPTYSEDDLMLDFEVTTDFPGGNLKILDRKCNNVQITADMSGSEGDWFYWNFKATSEKERTVTFKTSKLANNGCSYSKDGGKTWGYLPNQGGMFTYTFQPNVEVQFAIALPYQLEDLNAYMKSIEDDPRVQIGVLCQSEQGRDVPIITIGDPDAPHQIVFTCRHHCCESTASYELEGVINYILSIKQQSFLKNFCFTVIPMVDIDGVENGDQGKNRIPHDHNRDYEETIYSSVQAIKNYFADRDVDVHMDFHCPTLWDDKPYFYVYSEDKEEINEFTAILKDIIATDPTEGKIVYDGSADYQSGNHYSDNASGFFFITKGAAMATTLEFPYAGVKNTPYTRENIRHFGMNVGKAFEQYLLANYDSNFSITVDSNIQNGTVFSNVYAASKDTPVFVTVSPEEGYRLVPGSLRYNGFEIKESGQGEYQFLMPAEDVVITAEFEPIVPDVYLVSIDEGIRNGTVTASVYEAPKGTNVILTVRPESGYRLIPGSLTYNEVEIALNEKGEYHFSMPAEDVVITAEFEPIPENIFTIEIDPDISHGKISSDKLEAAAGEKVVIRVTPNNNYRLKVNSLQYNNGIIRKNGGEYAFEMPEEDVVITAKFEQIPSEHTESGNLTGGSGVGGPSVLYRTVVFQTNGGSDVKSTKVVNGDTVAEPVPPDRNGYTFLGWYQDAAGNIAYRFSAPVFQDLTLYAKWEKETILLPFTDIDDHWAEESIRYTVENGLFEGVSEEKFEPDLPMSRAMLTTVLFRYADETPGKSSFADVKEEDWFAGAVGWAAEKGIVTGVGENRFDPASDITREEFLVMLYRFCNVYGIGDSTSQSLDRFQDSENVSDWAKDAVMWACSNNLITGKPGQIIDPQGVVTRAETAAIVQRVARL